MTTNDTTTRHDVRMTIDTNDDGTFIRTAIKLSDDQNSGSIVICDREGRALFMLNMFCWDDGADVDVIPIGRYRQLKALAWDNGTPIILGSAPADQLIAIDARKAH